MGIHLLVIADTYLVCTEIWLIWCNLQEEAEVKQREIENQNEKMTATITETVGDEHKFDVDRLIKAHKQRMKLYEGKQSVPRDLYMEIY